MFLSTEIAYVRMFDNFSNSPLISICLIDVIVGITMIFLKSTKITYISMQNQ